MEHNDLIIVCGDPIKDVYLKECVDEKDKIRTEEIIIRPGGALNVLENIASIIGIESLWFEPREIPQDLYTIIRPSMVDREIFLTEQSKKTKHYYTCSPIYDYSAKDIWVATSQFDWDYNQTYDIFMKCGVSLENQRVCPPYGEEPLRGLWLYAECFPEMWHKMLERVKGVATAWRYANTDLYGSYLKEPPANMTWKEYFPMCLKLNRPKEQKQLYASINQLIKQHNRKSRDKLPDNDNHRFTGIGWKLFCKMALRGDLKGRTARTLTWDISDVGKEKSNYLEHRKKGVQ